MRDGMPNPQAVQRFRFHVIMFAGMVFERLAEGAPVFLGLIIICNEKNNSNMGFMFLIMTRNNQEYFQ